MNIRIDKNSDFRHKGGGKKEPPSESVKIETQKARPASALSEWERAYGLGVTAGKLEALQYTPDERERYGKWAAEGEMCRQLAEQRKELLEACRDALKCSPQPVNWIQIEKAIANATKTDSGSEAGSVQDGNEVR